jgi:hypothetical protein
MATEQLLQNFQDSNRDGVRFLTEAFAEWLDILGLIMHAIIFGFLGIWGLRFAEKQALKKGDISFY